jgi:hypothetical protein
MQIGFAVSKRKKPLTRRGSHKWLFDINLLSGELFPSAMGKMALPIVGCYNPKRLILNYNISINSLKMVLRWVCFA